jgi:hypothetical protein
MPDVITLLRYYFFKFSLIKKINDEPKEKRFGSGGI